MTVPATVAVSLPTSTLIVGGTVPYTFRDFVEFLVDHDPRFQRPAPNVRAGARLLASLDAAIAAKRPEWLVPRPDWELLHAVAEDPACGYARFERRDTQGNRLEAIHVPARMLLPYVDAIAGARGVPENGAARVRGGGLEIESHEKEREEEPCQA